MVRVYESIKNSVLDYARVNGRTNNPFIFWRVAMNHASHVFSVKPEKKFSKDGISRYERFFARTPDLTRLRVFGCTATCIYLGKYAHPLVTPHVSGYYI